MFTRILLVSWRHSGILVVITILLSFSTSHQDYDPFSDQKKESLFSTMDSVKSLSRNVLDCTKMLGKQASDEAVRLEYETLLQVSLTVW